MRLLLLVLGLGLVAVALYALVVSSTPPRMDPRGEIGAGSRAEMERVLRDAEGEEQERR